MAILIKTIAEVKAVIPMNMTADFERLNPFLANAERLYVQNLIGKDEFTDMQTIYTNASFNTANIIDPIVKKSILIAQKIICNIGYLFAIPLLSVSVGASGIQINSSADKKNAFQWQIEDIKKSIQELGGSAIEEMLILADENPLIFDKYIISENYQKQKKYLITTAAEFSDYFEIKKSRFLFQSLCSLMYRVESQIIEKTIGENFLATLKLPNTTAQQKKLSNKYIKPALALLTVAKAINERVFAFNDGVVSYNFIAANQENLKSSKEVLQEKILPLVKSLTDDANVFLQDAQSFITANASDFPTFVAPLPNRRFKATNRPDSGIFIT